MNKQITDDITIKELFLGIWHYKALMIKVIVIGFIVGVLCIAFQYIQGAVNDDYTAELSMSVISKNASGSYAVSNAKTPNEKDIILSRELVDSVEFIIKSKTAYYNIMDSSELDITYQQYTKSILIKKHNQTQIIQVFVALPSKNDAILLANTIADEMPDMVLKVMDVGGMNIIDRPFTANENSNKLNFLWLFIGVFISAFIAICWSIMKTVITPTVVSSDTVSSHLLTDFLVEIPHYTSREKRGLMNPDEIVNTKAFGCLVNMVKKSLSDINGNTLMIFSALKSEGKTVIATSIAQSLANFGYRTLLIDCDTKMSNLSKIFDTAEHIEKHLNYVSDGEKKLEEIVIHLSDKLDLIQSYQTTKMLINKNIVDEINNIKDRYDYIIIDTAPVCLTSDTFNLQKCVDAALLVVKQGYASCDLINTSISELSNIGFNIMGCVLNDVKKFSNQLSYYSKHYNKAYYNNAYYSSLIQEYNRSKPKGDHNEYEINK